MVEEKRFRRSLPAVINGVTAAQAVNAGLVEPEHNEVEEQYEPGADHDDEESLFFPEGETEESVAKDNPRSEETPLNPKANLFQPKANNLDLSKPSSTFGTPALGPGLAFPTLSSTSKETSLFGPSSAMSKADPKIAASVPPALPDSTSTTSPWSFKPFAATPDQIPPPSDTNPSTASIFSPATVAPSSAAPFATPAFSWGLALSQGAQNKNAGEYYMGLASLCLVDSSCRYSCRYSRRSAPPNRRSIWKTSIDFTTTVESSRPRELSRTATTFTTCTSRDEDVNTFWAADHLNVDLKPTTIQTHALIQRARAISAAQ